MKKIRVVSVYLLLYISLSITGVQAKEIHVKPSLSYNRQDTNLILPPSWAFGILYGGYTNQKQTIERVNELMAHDYPVDSYWIDSWFWSFADHGKGPQQYIDFVADTVDYPDRKAMWDYLEKKNIKGGFWIWDCIFKTGNEKAFDDFRRKGYFKNTYIETSPWHNNDSTTAMFQTKEDDKSGTICGNIDFDNPEAVAYFKQQMKHFFDEGADFIKLDRTSAIPVCKAMFEMTQTFGKETKGRGFILSHTGGMETEAYKHFPGKWTDDTRSDWTVEQPTKDFNAWVPRVGLKENIAMYTDPLKRSSKIPFLTNDLGGFDRGRTNIVDESLYIRWMQFSIFSPIVEVFSQPENPTSNLAYRYSKRADKLFRQYSHLRMELFPYIYSYAQLARLKSGPMIRKIPGQLYEYLFGNELFVAPVYERDSVERQCLLPSGKWVNFWTDETVDGGKHLSISAPIEQIPLMVRQGSVIPMRPYARSIEKGTNDTIILHVYPGAGSEFTLIEDDGSSNDYLKGAFSKTIIRLSTDNENFVLNIAPTIGQYKGMSLKRTWKIIIHGIGQVNTMACNGKPVLFMLDGKTTVSTFFVSNKRERERIRVTYK
ncbi:MAG: glycoside hydrolase family 31 protein [Bacteroidota bacterium]|nr:glycoside hydrolase family 31 protein [Bacteroidota bacterium]